MFVRVQCALKMPLTRIVKLPRKAIGHQKYQVHHPELCVSRQLVYPHYKLLIKIVLHHLLRIYQMAIRSQVFLI